jgi:uncharacterized oxidoreductase
MKLSGNTVLVTGGASGIGFAFAEAFLEAGSEVIICGRDSRKLDEAQKQHGKFHTIECDITNEKHRTRLYEWITTNLPNLNILINNAGVQRDIDFTHGIKDYKGKSDEISINLEAPIIMSGLFIPLLKGKPEAAIINITSGLGLVPAAKMPVYSATKAGLHIFTMTLRHQLKSEGIKVFEVVPPAVDTDLNPEGRAKRGGIKVDLKPKEFVGAIMKGIEADIFEIGFRTTEKSIMASREDLKKAFEQMNSRW